MFFERRRWALRVTEKMGLVSASAETTLLGDLLIWSAKEDEEMMLRAMGKSFSKAEGILMGALSMVNNHSAVTKVSQDLRIQPQAAEDLLLAMRKAALVLAQENDFETLVKVATQK